MRDVRSGQAVYRAGRIRLRLFACRTISPTARLAIAVADHRHYSNGVVEWPLRVRESTPIDERVH